MLALLTADAATRMGPPNYKMSVLLLAPMTALMANPAARDLAGIRGVSASPRMVLLGFAALSPVLSTVARAAIYHWIDDLLMRRFSGRRTGPGRNRRRARICDVPENSGAQAENWLWIPGAAVERR